MRHGYIILTLNSKQWKHTSSLPPKKFQRVAKRWLLCSGTARECSWLTTCKRVNSLIGSITCTYPTYNTRERGWQYSEIDRYYYASNLCQLKEAIKSRKSACWCFFAPAGQYSYSHSTSGSCKSRMMQLWTVAPCTLPSRFGTIRLLPIPQTEIPLVGPLFWEWQWHHVLLKASLLLRLQTSSKLEYRWLKCIEVQGDYVKNNIEMICIWRCFLVVAENFLNFPRMGNTLNTKIVSLCVGLSYIYVKCVTLTYTLINYIETLW